MKVAVFGASGLVGQAVVDALRSREGVEVCPIIHSPGNAWALAAKRVPLIQCDLLDKHAVARIVGDSTHIVNCVRGDERIMLEGLANLIKAARQSRVYRFVHFSSVAVYGDPPPPDSSSEFSSETPTSDYGRLKLKQDRMVERLSRYDVQPVILCPPNITGANSRFMAELLEALQAGRFAQLDDGRQPLNTVDVRNLSHAVERALFSETVDSRRYFITDGEDITWADIIDYLESASHQRLARPSITREALLTYSGREETQRGSLLRMLKHLVSSDVRQALRQDPWLGSIDKRMRKSIARLPTRIEDRLRLAIEGPLKVKTLDLLPPINRGLCLQQLRAVRHSCQRAVTILGYSPKVSVHESVLAFWRSHSACTAELGTCANLLQLLDTQSLSSAYVGTGKP